MSNTGKFVDNTPFIPMAGITTALEGISSDQSIRQDLYYKPRTMTPSNIVKYRKTAREIPGIKQIHHGIYDDPRDYEDLIHGNKTLDSDHVPDCMKGNNLSGNKYFMNHLKEKHYASSKREPLGKSLIRNYIFPEEVKQDAFRFGIPTTGFYNAKDVIYNGCLLNEPDEVKKMYRTTHGLTDPGEQKVRNYNWYVDKNKHAFGLPQEKEVDGAKKSLLMDQLTAPYPQTKIVGKRLEDFRQATGDMLGRGKFRGTLHPSLGDDHMFGLKSTLGGNWNAGKCIYGDPNMTTKEALLPDIDLGKDVKYRSKIDAVKPITYDINKTFGVPSIRNDLPKKNFVSVCDLNNYGNEKDVYELLYPHPCATRGIDDDDFDYLYTKQEINELLKTHDYSIPLEEFNVIYQVGLKNYPNEEEKLSPNAFLATMRNLKREYMKYRTLVDA